VMSTKRDFEEKSESSSDKKLKTEKIDVVDPHMHFWTKETHPWVASYFQHPYVIEDYLKDAKLNGFNLVKCVNVQANGNDPVEETKWLQGLAEKHGFPHGIIGFADLGASESDVVAQLEAQMKYPNFRGIRFMLDYDKTHKQLCQTSRPDWLSDENWLKNFGLLEKYKLIFDLQVRPWQLPDAANLAAKYPKVQLILNHAGFPYSVRCNITQDDSWSLWKDGMSLLAKQPNVAVKISEFAMCDAKYTADNIQRYVATTVDLFGVDRCMFATNFPVDKEGVSMQTIYDDFLTIVERLKLSEADKKALFHDNALKFYKI